MVVNQEAQSATIRIDRVAKSRLREVDLAKVAFSSVFSDHMFCAEFADGRWSDGLIQPHGPIPSGRHDFMDARQAHTPGRLRGGAYQLEHRLSGNRARKHDGLFVSGFPDWPRGVRARRPYMHTRESRQHYRDGDKQHRVLPVLRSQWPGRDHSRISSQQLQLVCSRRL